jgi:hypothetical protein
LRALFFIPSFSLPSFFVSFSFTLLFSFTLSSVSSVFSVLSFYLHSVFSKKGKAVPLHAMEALGGRGGI